MFGHFKAILEQNILREHLRVPEDIGRSQWSSRLGAWSPGRRIACSASSWRRRRRRTSSGSSSPSSASSGHLQSFPASRDGVTARISCLKQQEATSRDGLMRDATTIRILSCSSLPRSPRNCPSWAPGLPCQGACDRR